MPDCFSESSEGVILVANGIDPMVRWDGFADQFTTAGVVAPTTQPAVVAAGASGSASIVGIYRCYLRFVDKYGNFSNLSPVSDPTQVNGSILYANIATTYQPTVARRQILRNTNGQLTVFYVDVDTTDLVSTSFTSTTIDENLANNDAVPLLDANGKSLANLYDPPPDTKPFIVYHLNRMWAVGQQPYSEGSVSITRGSATVLGAGTNWPANFVGRFIYITGATKSYEIAAIDVASQLISLTEFYGDDTDQYAAYSIKPSPAEASLLYYSEAGLPESWPPVNALSLPEDADVVTGLFNYGSFLYVAKRHRLYQVSAQDDPAIDGFVFASISRGCVNNRSWVVVDETVYLMDEGGIYKFSGGTDAEQISTPIQNLFRKSDPGTINWQAQRYFHAVFDPSTEIVRWFVCLRGDYLPRHALAYAYKLNKWWVEEYAVPIGASCNGQVGRPTGGWAEDTGVAVFLGGPASEVYSSGGSTLDGIGSDAASIRGKVSSAGLDTLTDVRAAFDTTWENVPVTIVSGRGQGQRRVVVEASATVLRLDESWTVTPDTTSIYQVGGFNYVYRSQRMRYSFSEDQTGRSAEFVYVPTETAMAIMLSMIHDFASDAVPIGRRIDGGRKNATKANPDVPKYEIDLSYQPGSRIIRFDGHRELEVNAPRFLTIILDGSSGPDQVRVGDMVLNGLVR